MLGHFLKRRPAGQQADNTSTAWVVPGPPMHGEQQDMLNLQWTVHLWLWMTFPGKAYSIVLAAGAWTALSNQPCVIPQQAAINAAGGIVLKRPSLVQTSAMCFSLSRRYTWHTWATQDQTFAQGVAPLTVPFVCYLAPSPPLALLQAQPDHQLPRAAQLGSPSPRFMLQGCNQAATHAEKAACECPSSMHTLATGAWPYLAALPAFPCAAAQRWQPSKHMTPTGVCLHNTSV